MPQTPSDVDLVAAFLTAVKDYSGHEVARMVADVTADDMSRWRRGEWKRISSPKRRAITGFLEQREETTTTPDEQKAEDLFHHFEGMIRQMGGTGADPEELVLRKLDAVEGIRRLYAATTGIPEWVYGMERRIKRGEL